MKQNTNFIEKQFQLNIESSDLIKIKLFQINDDYFGFPKKNFWIIDGGIEIKFRNTTFCLAWNQDKASFSFENKSFDKIYGEDNYTELNADFIKNLNQKKICNANLKWLEYDIILDYTMATKKESKLVEINIEFESSESLQIATVRYEIEENSSPRNYFYDINGELLIALNNKIEINNID
ncbi:hypothetical protein MWU58_14430 [Flavobacteriaceae bacterium S0825]|uniref:hypothetical protein n=1 Tax=Gaetbulibacter sp. S0825 TaxID=2720084 RepID=UPI0014310D95|nr:hypothetical protein [Gaetbulibacter sp. S0825]MCK0110492.1 hypothetical protein [Flavobacteriaceae bacterium S0825]NIX66121.1 hypothetical protein [Gaetbulibacter sp. S0825]